MSNGKELSKKLLVLSNQLEDLEKLKTQVEEQSRLLLVNLEYLENSYKKVLKEHNQINELICPDCRGSGKDLHPFVPSCFSCFGDGLRRPKITCVVCSNTRINCKCEPDLELPNGCPNCGFNICSCPPSTPPGTIIQVDHCTQCGCPKDNPTSHCSMWGEHRFSYRTSDYSID